MTQKELLYVEDAIGHEKSIISIIQNSLKDLTDEELTNFLEGEITKHTETKERLINLLEVNSNGQ